MSHASSGSLSFVGGSGGATPAARPPATRTTCGRATPATSRSAWKRTFLHDVPAAVRGTLGPGRDEAEIVFAQTAELTAWPAVPIRVLTGRDDRFFPADFQRRLALSRLGVAPDLVPGGHLAALSHPAEVADRLVTYAASAG